MNNRFILAAMSLLIALTIAILPATGVSAQTSPFLGDVNGDGKISTLDLIQIIKHLKGSTQLSCMARLRADVNANRKVDENDIALIQQYILGQITMFPEFGHGLGDANEDGKVSTLDLIRIAQHLNGSQPLSYPWGEANADVATPPTDTAGGVTATDAEMIKACILGTISKLPEFLN